MPEIATTDIWRAANMMIELYGGDATVRAAMRADALLEQGDMEGFFTWKRIARAIDDLSRTERQAGEQEALRSGRPQLYCPQRAR